MFLNSRQKNVALKTSAGLSRPREDFSPVRGVSTVSAALNTPMVKRVFRQGPYHVTVPLQPCSLQAVGEYQAQHSTGGLSEGRGGVEGGGPAGHGGFVWKRETTAVRPDRIDRLFICDTWINKRSLWPNTSHCSHLGFIWMRDVV